MQFHWLILVWNSTSGNEVVSALNLKPILAVYERKDNRGGECYHPEMLTRPLLCGYASGVTGSRRIEKATYDPVPFRYRPTHSQLDTEFPEFRPDFSWPADAGAT